VVTHQLQVEHRTGKVRQSETDVLPLCNATNLGREEIWYDAIISGVGGAIKDVTCELFSLVGASPLIYIRFFNTIGWLTGNAQTRYLPMPTVADDVGMAFRSICDWCICVSMLALSTPKSVEIGPRQSTCVDPKAKRFIRVRGGSWLINVGLRVNVTAHFLVLWMTRLHVGSMCRFANTFMHRVNEDIAPGYHSIVHRSVKNSKLINCSLSATNSCRISECDQCQGYRS